MKKTKKKLGEVVVFLFFFKLLFENRALDIFVSLGLSAFNIIQMFFPNAIPRALRELFYLLKSFSHLSQQAFTEHLIHARLCTRHQRSSHEQKLKEQIAETPKAVGLGE